MKTKTYKTVDTGFASHDRYGWTAAGSMYCVAYSGTKFPQVIRVDASTEQVRENMNATYFHRNIPFKTDHNIYMVLLCYPDLNLDPQLLPVYSSYRFFRELNTFNMPHNFSIYDFFFSKIYLSCC